MGAVSPLVLSLLTILGLPDLESACFHLCSTRLTSGLPLLASEWDFPGLNSSFHACEAGTVWTDPLFHS